MLIILTWMSLKSLQSASNLQQPSDTQTTVTRSWQSSVPQACWFTCERREPAASFAKFNISIFTLKTTSLHPLLTSAWSISARPLRHNLARVAVTRSAVIGRLVGSPFLFSQSIKVQPEESRLFGRVRRDVRLEACETTEVAAAWWGGPTCPLWGQTVSLPGATSVCRAEHTHFTVLLRWAPSYTSHYGAY